MTPADLAAALTAGTLAQVYEALQFQDDDGARDVILAALAPLCARERGACPRCHGTGEDHGRA